MGFVFLGLICLGLIFLCFWLYSKLEYTKYDALSCVPAVIGVIFIICLIGVIVIGTYYGVRCLDFDTLSYQIQLTRDTYATQLEAYEYDRPNRLTESRIYLELRDNIIQFNTNVVAAKNHAGHWWDEGILWYRWYSNVEPIELN